jgi:exonuclease SbcC
MNSTLRTGPRVLLLDDPIAHVDDLNVLSFLDHLRAVSIDAGRQIFFATADDKVAALFRQKFKFLGTTEFRELTLGRSE